MARTKKMARKATDGASNRSSKCFFFFFFFLIKLLACMCLNYSLVGFVRIGHKCMCMYLHIVVTSICKREDE